MIIKKMEQSEAEIIANNWKYEGVYSFYDMTEDIEDYEEIISEEQRGDHYFSVLDNGELYGFFCVEQEGDNIEIGLGMKPQYTGKGNGVTFLSNILEFVTSKYSYETIILDVVSFNKRAIKVYERAGFTKTKEIMVNTNGGNYEFTVMELKKEAN